MWLQILCVAANLMCVTANPVCTENLVCGCEFTPLGQGGDIAGLVTALTPSHQGPSLGLAFLVSALPGKALEIHKGTAGMR